MFADTEYVILVCSGDRAYSCITYYHQFLGIAHHSLLKSTKNEQNLQWLTVTLCWVQVSVLQSLSLKHCSVLYF